METNQKKRIIEYIKKNFSKGYTSDTLRWALIRQGYSRTLVEQALEEAHKELSEKVPELKEKPKIIHEILDENDNVIHVVPRKKSFWRKIFNLD